MVLRDLLEVASPSMVIRLVGGGETIIRDFAVRVNAAIEKDEYGELLMSAQVGYITWNDAGELVVYLN
jgi:hypothetical protein